MLRTALIHRLTRTSASNRLNLQLRRRQMSSHKSIKQLLARYVPVTLAPSTSDLSEGDKAALKELILASKIMDKLYLKQTWSGASEMWENLQRNVNSATTNEEDASKLLRDYFWLNRGPWSILDENDVFVPGAPNKMKGANYYPEDLSPEEFESFIKANPHLEAQARGFFHTIRRDAEAGSRLKVVPYSEEYAQELRVAFDHLNKAADSCSNASLARFLRKRAEAFLSNEYFDSDVAWMEIDEQSALDVTIGPYEVYRDELFNYKASFESFLGLRDFAETAKLSRFSGALQDVEDNLPIDPQHRNTSLGALSPIVVINLCFSAGDVGGPQTAAFNLPNDEKVVELKGSKRTMLKNVQEEKFKNILLPIADLVIHPTQRHLVTFNAFFTHILAHELMHGLGPHKVTKSGQSVRESMQELHSALEEAKADITGLFALQHFIQRGIVPQEQEESFYVTFLASAFRSIRFGLEEAHGKGQAVQLTYLIERGAFNFDSASQTFLVDFARAKAAVIELSRVIMTIQAEGEKAHAAQLMTQYGILTQDVALLMQRIEERGIPVDIVPHFATAHDLIA